MRADLVDLVIGKRTVFVDRNGQQQMPEEYVLTEKDIGEGGMDLISSRLYFQGQEVAQIDQYPSGGYYGVNWRTGLSAEKGLDAIRQLYHQLTSLYDIRHPGRVHGFKTEDEAWRDFFYIFGAKLTEKFSDSGMPIKDFMDKATLREITQETILRDNPLMLRLQFLYGALFYSYKDLMLREENNLGILSHQDLSGVLPELVRNTHKLALSGYVIDVLRTHLRSFMWRYEPAIRAH